MLILSKIIPPSVTNLSQRPFFSWLALSLWIFRSADSCQKFLFSFSKMPRTLIAIFYLVASSAVHAQITSSINLDVPASRSEKSSQKTAPAKSQKITTTGLGATPTEAEKQALSEAVRQAVGALLDAKTLIENEEVIEDRILTVNNGFVKSYDVAAPARKNSDGVFEIKISAVIETSIVAQALHDAGIKGEMAGQNLWAESTTKSTNAKDALMLLNAKIPEYCKKLIKLQFIDANGAIASTNGRPRDF